MAVTTSYPGIYIQELPLSSHAIVPAPTSVAAFIGYSHPFKTLNFGIAQELFSFTNYETYFGPLFSSGLVDASLARAVYQFFLNGGSTAYVVGLQPGLFDDTDALITRLGSGGATISHTVATTGGGIIFTALEPTDIVPMHVTIANIRNSGATFDVVITYGTHVETYRGLDLGATPAHPATAAINGVSALVRVAADAGGWGTAITAQQVTIDYSVPANLSTGFNAADFTAVFQGNSSLDNIEIFNLLMVPGVTDFSVIAAGLAFAE